MWEVATTVGQGDGDVPAGGPGEMIFFILMIMTIGGIAGIFQATMGEAFQFWIIKTIWYPSIAKNVSSKKSEIDKAMEEDIKDQYGTQEMTAKNAVRLAVVKKYAETTQIGPKNVHTG